MASKELLPKARLLRQNPKRIPRQLEYVLIIVCISKSDTNPNLQNLSNPDPTADSRTTAAVNEQARYMVKTYARPPPVFLRGKGCYLWDIEDRKYLDLTAGIAVNALGHSDPTMAKIIADQVHDSPHSFGD